MKMHQVRGLIGIVFLVALQSCGLFGFHFNLQNPKVAGRVPHFSKEQVLLGEMTPLRSCFDVHYYDLAVEFFPEKKELAGVVEIHAMATTDFDLLQIDLHRNHDILSLTDANTGHNLPFRREKRAVYVSISRKMGEPFTLRVSYAGKPRRAKKPPWMGGFVWEEDEKGNPWAGVACESDGASLWWPLKDHTADEPDSMRLHYMVPEGLMAIGNGQQEGISIQDGKATFDWFISYPINTYNVTVYVGDFVPLRDTYTGILGETLNITHYVLPENQEVAKEHFAQLHEVLASFERQFGAYPWYRDGFKLVESPYAGMEHQTAIAYGNGYENDMADTYDYILVHETAHEWWGNSITAEDLADVWLQEGFATYAEALFLEDVMGKGAYHSHMSWYRFLVKNKYPVVGVKDRRWFHYKKNSDVYMKGAWILHTFRRQLDKDALFKEVIHSFHETYKRQVVSTEDFVTHVNEVTGGDYSWFFDHYLRKNFVPQMDYFLDEETGKLYYQWANVSEDFVPFRVDVRSLGNHMPIIPTQQIQTQQMVRDAGGRWSFRMDTDVLVIFEENDELRYR